MFPIIDQERSQFVDRVNPLISLPVAVEQGLDPEVAKLVADLSPETPWGDRQIAARRLGRMRSFEALPGLLDALPSDPFWMVRCAMIQAVEMIGNPGAIPTLREVVESDPFQVVRSYAAKAIERLAG